MFAGGRTGMSWKKVYIFALLTLFAAEGQIFTGYAWAGYPAVPAAQDSVINNFQHDELLRLTNQSRIDQGLLPLTVDAALARLAQEHAEAMAKQGFISHDMPSGDVFVRMNRVGYNYETVRENVASARTISYAHSALLKSPGHKANILATDVTRAGIGIAKGDPAVCGNYLFIAEVFASPRDDYEPSQIKELLTAHVEKLRQESLVLTKQDSTLEKLASGSLSTLNDAYSREDLRNLLVKSADELQKSGNSSVSRLEVSVQVLSTPEKLSVPDTIRQGLAEMYGAAVRRIMDKDNRPAFLVLTLTGISR